jgi:hypothetical protein
MAEKEKEKSAAMTVRLRERFNPLESELLARLGKLVPVGPTPTTVGLRHAGGVFDDHIPEEEFLTDIPCILLSDFPPLCLVSTPLHS